MRLDPIPVPLTRVGRGVHREQILEQHIVEVGMGNDPRDSFKDGEHGPHKPVLAVVVHHAEDALLKLSLCLEER